MLNKRKNKTPKPRKNSQSIFFLGRNVAVKEAAEQSSKMDVDLHDASFAVDGREQAAMASPSSEASSCTMTNIDSPSWWRVTLSLDALLTVIYISHNEDGKPKARCLDSMHFVFIRLIKFLKSKIAQVGLIKMYLLF